MSRILHHVYLEKMGNVTCLIENMLKASVLENLKFALQQFEWPRSLTDNIFLIKQSSVKLHFSGASRNGNNFYRNFWGKN